MLGLLVHVQTHVVAVLLGTDGAREVLPHWVHPICCYQRGAGQTKMSTALFYMIANYLGNTMAFECFVRLCMYRPPAEVYTWED